MNPEVDAILKRLAHGHMFLGAGIAISVFGTLAHWWPPVMDYMPGTGLVINVCVMIWSYYDMRRSERRLRERREAIEPFLAELARKLP